MPSRNPSDEESRKRARELALAVWVLLQKRERLTAALLIKAEARTLRAIKIAAAGAAAHAVTQMARSGASEDHAHRVLRSATPSMAAALERELVAQRRGARTIARTQLIKELGAPSTPARILVEADVTASHLAATSYATAWGQRAMGNLDTLTEGGPYRSPAHAVAEALDDTEGRLRRIAATEAADAFNDERETVYEDFGETPGMFKVWSAVLDGRTCDECFAIDGTTIAASKSFGKSPPLHPFCRCTITHIIIPKPQRLEDTKIDYDLFKSELRDVIREGRPMPSRYDGTKVISKRHAADFVRAAQTDRTKFGKPVRGPIVLTEKYANAKGDYERTRTRTKAKPR